MNKHSYSIKRASPVVIMTILFILFLSACGSVPATVTETLPSTQETALETAAPTIPPEPTASAVATVLPPDTPGLVTSLDEIVGKWLSRCGGGGCTIEFTTDGKYKFNYVVPTEGGVSFIEGGTITFSDSLFIVKTTNGSCETDQTGYYQATLGYQEDILTLNFTAAKADECRDRQNAISRGIQQYNE